MAQPWFVIVPAVLLYCFYIINVNVTSEKRQMVASLSAEELMLLNYGVGKDSWESLGLQGGPISPSKRRSVLNTHWKDWCWSWNSNTLATYCEELTHLKRPWCWERLRAGRKGDNRGWDGWMASPTQWTWVWVNSGSWWWTGRPGVLQFMGLQRVGHNWATELNWVYRDHSHYCCFIVLSYFTIWIISYFNYFLMFGHSECNY